MQATGSATSVEVLINGRSGPPLSLKMGNVMKRKVVDRSWFQSESEGAVIQLRTKSAVDHSLDRRAAEARARIEEEKRIAELKATRPVSLSKMRSISYWADLLGLEASTIREWCKNGVVKAQWLRNEWRITEHAMTEMLERENQRHARQG